MDRGHLPKIIYLHGFASSPQSSKARAFAERAKTAFDLDVNRLDLRVPSFEHLRLSAMIAATRAAIGGESERVVIVGSSLGGLTATRAAEADPRVCGLVLLAPAFRLGERWPARVGEAGFRAWRESGWLEVDDHATGTKSKVDFGFVDELMRLDADFPDVRVPTFIVHGGKDDVVDPTLSATFATGKPHVHRIEVDDGHELAESMPIWMPLVFDFLFPWFGRPKS